MRTFWATWNITYKMAVMIFAKSWGRNLSSCHSCMLSSVAFEFICMKLFMMTFVSTQNVRECVCIKVFVCVCVCLHVCLFVCVYVLAYLWVFVKSQNKTKTNDKWNHNDRKKWPNQTIKFLLSLYMLIFIQTNIHTSITSCYFIFVPPAWTMFVQNPKIAIMINRFTLEASLSKVLWAIHVSLTLDFLLKLYESLVLEGVNFRIEIGTKNDWF